MSNLVIKQVKMKTHPYIPIEVRPGKGIPQDPGTDNLSGQKAVANRHHCHNTALYPAQKNVFEFKRF